jgi:hypothetical protein
MLEPERHNFSVWRGTTFRVPISLWQDALHTEEYDISGWTGEMLILANRGGATVGTVDVTVEDPNLIELFADEDDTEEWDFGQGVYELKLNSGTDTFILFYGNVTVKDHA